MNARSHRITWILLSVILLALGAVVWKLSHTRAGDVPVQPSSEAIVAPTDDHAQPTRTSPTVEDSAAADSRKPLTEAKPEKPAAVAAPAADPANTVHGIVVDDLGAPVTHFELKALGSLPLTPTHQRLSGSRLPTADATLGGTYDDDHGSFALSLPPGDWSLTASRSTKVKSAVTSVTVPHHGPPLRLILPRVGTIVGSVFAPSGAPVADAKIYVQGVGEHEVWLREDHSAESRASTDASGRFEIEDVQPGTFQVTALHEGFMDAEWTEAVVKPGARVEVMLRMGEGGRITGRVDPSRGNVADRLINLYSFNGSLGWRNTRSDANGKFVIENVIPQAYIIELKPDGYPEKNGDQPAVRKNITVVEGQTIDVLLGEDRGTIHVAGVVTCDSKPAAGIHVHPNSKAGGEDRGQEPVTSEDGRFELDLDGPGDYSFTLSTGTGSSTWLERTITPKGEALVFDLPGGTVSGVVLSPDGAPLRYIPVTLLRDTDEKPPDPKKFWARYSRTHTDAKGAFEFKLLAPGTYALRAPDGYRRDSPPPHTPYGEVVMTGVRVEHGPVELPPVRLQPEGKIAGQVVDSAGAPVAGAALQMYDASSTAMFGYWEATADATGSFVIESVAPGAYTVGAQKSGKRGTSTSVQVDAGKTATVKVELSP